MKIAVFGHATATKICLNALLKMGHTVCLCVSQKKAAAVKKFGLNLPGVTVWVYDTISSPKLANTLADFAPDFIFSIINADKIPESILKIAPNGGLNFHPSLLPKYRSPDPHFWLLKDGETESGITVHKMTSTFDAGNIVYQLKFPISPYETYGTYIARLRHWYGVVITDVLTAIESGTLTDTSQAPSPYYPKVTLADICIDWSETATNIEALTRACNPGRYSLTVYKQMVLEIIQISVTQFPAVQPGKVVLQNDTLFISARDVLCRIDALASGNEGIFSGHRFAEFCAIPNGDFFTNFRDAFPDLNYSVAV